MKPSSTFLRTFFLIIALFPGLGSASVRGLPISEREAYKPEYHHVQGREISREAAASLVKRRYGGKILAISETRRNGQAVYRVKGLSDKSQVYVVYVDKQSGRISQ
ncbi:PepSY domain-containing protein [Microbulbifer sp. 2205BS26-8]|uniref:PepSY domain-containing protein n=1 Tax=Microbulbifer sp. 2205BS26-8 TaxID=3064386 RepID=UPI00273FBFD3|nr:PepSY domain-containing protein [Microbulbifer sp. 2205BS26-8]MDP5209955.1 PepSY domain-containing protein [Microbulbifer sp. 2205BS26-8]